KVAELFGSLSGITSNESDANSETGCAGQKVLSCHQKLTKVTHCCLAGVGLPCSRSCKTYCRVSREIRRNRRRHHFRKEPRKPCLRAQCQIEKDYVGCAENTERYRVAFPIHFALTIDSDKPVD